MHFDYAILITVLLVVVGAGLFRVGLHIMPLKGESPQGARRAWLFIALGIVFGVAAVLNLLLKAIGTGLSG
jgi:hypothetical protein